MPFSLNCVRSSRQCVRHKFNITYYIQWEHFGLSLKDIHGQVYCIILINHTCPNKHASTIWEFVLIQLKAQVGGLTNRLALLVDKQIVLIEGQTGFPYLGQTGCPYWGTNRFILLGDKQIALIGGQTGFPYWETNRLPLLGDKQLVLIGDKHFTDSPREEQSY